MHQFFNAVSSSVMGKWVFAGAAGKIIWYRIVKITRFKRAGPRGRFIREGKFNWAIFWCVVNFGFKLIFHKINFFVKILNSTTIR